MRSKFIFLLAIIMGVVTTVLFVQYMDKSQVAETSQPIKTVQVVRAATLIPENTIITEEMLEVVEVPEDNVHELAIQDKEEAIGKFAVDRIEQGEIVLSHRIRSQQEESAFISRKLREGHRAVSVGVNIVQSVSNLIKPGDQVDVIYTPSDEDEEGKRVSKQILSDVHVLAIGRTMITSNDEPYVEYSEVTLELQDKEAVTLIEGYETGSIHLTIHPSLKEEDE